MLAFFALAGGFAALAVALGAHALAPHGMAIWKWVLLAGLLGAAPWAGICAAHAVLGILARPAPPAPRVASRLRTAIAVTLRNEDIHAVLPPLRRLLDGLEAEDAGARFALAFLSDSDAGAEAAEADAVARFRATDPRPERIHYRRRPAPLGYKAGNLMEFLDGGAALCPLVLVLDADSEMSAATVLRLVGEMEGNPHLGIVQHLTTGLPARAAFPRIFQFGMRAGMRIWARGQAWWQADCGPFWGHNAVLRVAPFRAHARLPALPDGSRILSHDQVEAARLQAAGWGVRLVADEAGSQEANPPTLPDFCARDLRWMTGNLQYRHLLLRPGLRFMGRWQLAQAMLMFAAAPFQCLVLLAAAWGTALGDGASLPCGRIATATLAWAAMLHAPRVAGFLEFLLPPAERARFGGGPRILAGMLVEMIFAVLLDGVCTVNRTIGLIRRGRGWPRQNRADRALAWREAIPRFLPHTMLGLAMLAMFATAPLALLWSLPLIAGMILAAPFAVATSHPALSHALTRARLCAVPEERPAADAVPDAAIAAPV